MLNHPPFHKAIFIMFANFYYSDNFVRLCIVQVFRESQKHLDKINNIEEFQIRIFQVIHSNDPVARAITIRYFIVLIVSYLVDVWNCELNFSRYACTPSIFQTG